MDLCIHPSRIFFIILLLVYAVGLVCVFVSKQMWWLKLLCLVLQSGYFAYTLHRYVLLRSYSSIVRVAHRCVQKPDGMYLNWSLVNRSGEILEAKLSKSSVVWRHSVILHFQLDGFLKLRSVFLLVDSLPEHMFRRLKAYLRHY